MDLKRIALRRLWLPRRTRHRWSRALSEVDFRQRLAVARKEGGNAVQNLLQERSADEYLDYEDSEIYFTKTLVAQARHLRVPVPQYPPIRGENEWWNFSDTLGEPYLTTKGVAELREAIRKEHRWEHELRLHWIAWLTAITGAIGALIGLVATLMN